VSLETGLGVCPLFGLHLHKSDWDGDIIPLPTTASQYLINTMLWMKKEAYEDSTIKCVAKRLAHLARYSTLADPEAIKTFVADKQCSNAYKESLIEAYAINMRSTNQTWKQLFYNRYDKLPKLPTEEKLNMMIAKAERRMALFLSMSKDLGTRPIELTWLKVADIDLTNGVVNITGAKHTIGRTGKLKPQTLEMLRAHITRKNLNLTDRIFPTIPDNVCNLYRRLRNHVAEKLQDPTIRQIRLYDFRHWRASIEYHRTKDLLHVKNLLGHKDLRTTLRYTHSMKP